MIDSTHIALIVVVLYLYISNVFINRENKTLRQELDALWYFLEGRTLSDDWNKAIEKVNRLRSERNSYNSKTLLRFICGKR